MLPSVHMSESMSSSCNSENHSMVKTTNMETYAFSVRIVTYIEMSSSGRMS
jgi:hypothetical protein